MEPRPLIAACLSLCLYGGEALAESLSGHVKQDGVRRIARPRAPVLHGTAGAASAATDASRFSSALQQSAAGVELSEPAAVKPLSPLTSKPLLPAGTAEGASNSGGAGGAPANYDYSAKPGLDSKTVVFRLKRFHSQQEMEVAWEAAVRASRMLKKGANVVILLDMEAVHAADRNDTQGAFNETNRGNGNQAAQRLTSPQDHLTEFTAAGGKLVVSARWVKLFSISQSALVPGAQLASEEEIDDLLLEAANTIDY